MARLGPDPEREARAAGRRCGACSLCCTVLRVDELAKPAGRDCPKQIRSDRTGSDGRERAPSEGGCSIHATRPAVCRGYACLWLQGGLEDDERPDRTGAVVDLEAGGTHVVLRMLEATPGALDASPALQAIANRMREQMPVRVVEAGGFDDPDRPYRVFEANGLERRVRGDVVETLRDGVTVEIRRQPWAERLARRVSNAWRASRARRIARRGEPGI